MGLSEELCPCVPGRVGETVASIKKAEWVSEGSITAIKLGVGPCNSVKGWLPLLQGPGRMQAQPPS